MPFSFLHNSLYLMLHFDISFVQLNITSFLTFMIALLLDKLILYSSQFKLQLVLHIGCFFAFVVIFLLFNLFFFNLVVLTLFEASHLIFEALVIVFLLSSYLRLFQKLLEFGVVVIIVVAICIRLLSLKSYSWKS